MMAPLSPGPLLSVRAALVLLIAVVVGLVAGSWTIFEWGDGHSSADRWRRRR
jgi:hypothetical protein